MRRVMLRGLKTLAISHAEFIDRFGVTVESVFDTELRDLAAAGLIAREPDRIVLTRKGRAYCTNVFDRFLTEDDRTPPAAGQVQWGLSTLVEEAP
jgi:oxygen-independent coproporphyrinogen-3 oxidase